MSQTSAKKQGKQGSGTQETTGTGTDLGWQFPALDSPVNAFSFSAEFSAQLLEKHPGLNTAENQARIAWLREMGRLIPDACHTRPQVLLVLGEAALDAALRRSLVKVLLRVDSIASQALREQKRTAKQGKPVRKAPRK